ncbi:MAG TPA: hypothetical protein VFW74_17295 [Acidimicrobiia bacterium]|nr:hypothetical protein [Acidimicrobiia bacterium]
MAKLTTTRVFSSVLVDRVLRPKFVIDIPIAFPAVVDGHPAWLANGRTRPRYFDGRFLAARDLDRDQKYFADRTAEHFRAVGPGVIHGLLVSAKGDSTLVVSPGVAVTPSGGLVAVRDHAKAPQHDQPLELPLFELADTQRFDQAFGLLRTPRDLPRRRTGIYVLLARPVEYTADPVGLYPASIDTRRAPEDGDIIEGVAFTLAPYHDAAGDVDPARQRATLARHIFVDQPDPGAIADAVPLALVRLDRGFITWVDPWLVRRELGPAHGGIGKLARAPRAIAEAHVQQYHGQLAAIAATRSAAGRPAAFAAGEELAALPPAGAFPVAALELATGSERFFPQPMPVICAVVPEDEIAAIVADQLAMPPIDLMASDDQLAATPVAVLVPVPRAIAETLPADLRSFPLRSSAVAPGRTRARSAVVLESLAARFSTAPTTDDRGSRLATAIGTVANTHFARLRRGRAAVAGGVVSIDHQLIG